VAQATSKKPKRPKKSTETQLGRGVREAMLVMLVAIGVYLYLALISYDRADPGFTLSNADAVVSNLGGSAGAFFAGLFLFLFGYLAYIAPMMVMYSGWLLYKGVDSDGHPDYRVMWLHWIGFILTLVAGCGLASMHFEPSFLPADAGGVLGSVLSDLFILAFNYSGATLLLLAVFLAGISIFSSLSWLRIIDLLGKLTVLSALWLSAQCRHTYQKIIQRRDQVALEKARTPKFEARLAKPRKKPRIEPTVNTVKVSKRAEREKQIPLFEGKGNNDLPPLMLLDNTVSETAGYSDAALEALSRQVELKLLDFNIEAEVSEVHPGPIVTRFELLLAPGLKVSKVSALAKDLARALSVISVRIVEVIPGKPSIGLEIPNESREMVRLSEIIKSNEFDESKSPVSMALGKDIGGLPVVVNLAAMPHLLVAGTTGSGKSVAVNAMILSLLYKATAEDVRMILIDPKMLELSVYEGIPHLLTPVVTDMKEAANALRWSVAEMERRYKLMSALGVRNLSGYNSKITEGLAKGEPVLDPLFKVEDQLSVDITAPELEKLPLIVIVVDEFADMMMVVGKKVEDLIARLAQKARAAGIHLILATQRPSVDVITGLIKANIPTRMAFQVSSKIDSRTILDQMGAEQLLGHGDMLYLPPGTSIPERVHGAFVSDQEVHNVCDFLRQRGQANYLEEILTEPVTGIPGLDDENASSDDEMDPLYDQAVAIVTETRKASISYVQRRLKVGYNRAARMIEEMENSGVVSSVQSNGSREVLAPAPPR
jgi:S-DNA-T family DNA segregation ATPase FtsK/SpoIIIE|tara:strand:- start:182 stop:2491 length:2310 start_codon:yes stop_codon:yes gene_type:complete